MEENIKNFKCLGKACPNHCCGAFSGISEKLDSISGINYSDIILLPEDVEAITKICRGDLIVKTELGIDKIRTKEDGTCLALKDGRCSIYEARPAICKAYPLYLDMFAGLSYVNECSAFSSQIKKEEYKNALKSLLDIYQFWIDYYKEK